MTLPRAERDGIGICLNDVNAGEIGRLSQPGDTLHNIEHFSGGLIPFPGGFPIENRASEGIGGNGMSSSAIENDHDVAHARAAVASWETPTLDSLVRMPPEPGAAE